MAVDSPELRKGILYNLLKSDEYCQKVLPFLTKDYFTEKHERIIFEEIYNYYASYNNAPNQAAIKIEVESRNDLTESVYNETMKLLDADVEPISKVDFLVNKTEQWCQERAIVEAVYKAVNVIGGDDKKNSSSWILEEWSQPTTEREWGRYTVLDKGPGWQVKQLSFDAGKSLSDQRHFKRSEHWHVVDGEIEMKLEEYHDWVTMTKRLKSGDSIDIPIRSWHKATNVGTKTAVVVEVWLGEELTEDDIERRD